jgi:hypothetical protein
MVKYNSEILIFTFNKVDIFDEVKLKTSYQGRDLYDKEGNYIGEPVILTDDERNIFEVYFKEASNRIGDEFRAAVEPKDISIISNPNGLEIQIKNKFAYDENIIGLIQTACTEYFTNFIISKYLMNVNQFDLAKAYAAGADILGVHNLLYEIRKSI